MLFRLYRRPCLFHIVILAVALSLGFSSASAQELAQPSPSRPKLALVLSGGGARGLAHVGVLEWLEDHRIPVDIVTGTSMGGLIGAMYATGMTAHEAHEFISAIDWDKTLLPEPDYDQLGFRRKEDHRSYQLGIPLGLKNGLAGPNGFNPGHGAALLFDRVAFGYSEVGNFDNLPIPYRCVATDLLSGSPVVLNDGQLSQALRATMAIPGVFTPVEIGDKVLVDGGLVDNIPTDVARSLGAKAIIAVDVAAPLAGRSDLQTLGGVLNQTLNIVTLENERRGRSLADVVIAPDLGKISGADFPSAEKIMRLGYEGAEKSLGALVPYALTEDEWRQHLRERYARKRTPSPLVAEIEVTGATGNEKDRLQAALDKYEGHELDVRGLETDLTRVTGEGRFDLLGYESFAHELGTGVRIRAHEKNYGPPFVDLAINVQGSGTGNFDFSAGFRVTMMDVRQHGGEWRSDVVLGGTNFIASEFYQPLGASRFFVAPRGFYLKQARNAFSGVHQVAQYHDRRLGAGFDVGYATGRRSEARVGYEYFNGSLSPVVGAPTLPGASGNNGVLRARFDFEGQDSPNIPSRGPRLLAEFDHVIHAPGVTHSFQQLKLRVSQFIPVSSRGSVFGIGSFGTSFSRDAGFFQKFPLGGPFALGAYSRDEFLGNHFAYASVGYRYEVFRLPVLVGKKVYAIGSFESGSAFDDFSRMTAHHSINVGALAETILGPVALTSSVSTTGRTKVNFSIGRLF
jgi:NTE family protein